MKEKLLWTLFSVLVCELLTYIYSLFFITDFKLYIFSALCGISVITGMVGLSELINWFAKKILEARELLKKTNETISKKI
jgi:hypothetical protein